MPFRYAFLAAAAFAAAGMTEAHAQSPFPPVGQEQQKASPFPPIGRPLTPFPQVGQSQPSPFPPAGTQALLPSLGQPMQPQQQPPCFKDFMVLRQEVDKQFEVVKTTLSKKPSAAEACSALSKFTKSETSLIKFVTREAPNCNFPPGLLESIKQSNEKTEGYRKQACTAASAARQRPARPAEPTLSDALAPPAPSASNTRTGRGTLDTLSGNALAR